MVLIRNSNSSINTVVKQKSLSVVGGVGDGVYLSRNYRLIVAPRDFDVLNTNIRYICRYRKALYFGSLGISLHLELFCLRKLTKSVFRYLQKDPKYLPKEGSFEGKYAISENANFLNFLLRARSKITLNYCQLF